MRGQRTPDLVHLANGPALRRVPLGRRGVPGGGDPGKRADGPRNALSAMSPPANGSIGDSMGSVGAQTVSCGTLNATVQPVESEVA